MNKEQFFSKYGQRLTEEEISTGEHSMIKPMYDSFEEQLRRLKKNKNKDIEFCIINSYNLNAHAIKTGENEYLIAFRSGILPMVTQLIGEQLDFFEKHLSVFGEKEDILGLSLYFVFSYLFGHELGHILRGHTAVTNNRNMINIDDEIIFSATSMLSEMYGKDKNKFQMLLELDADTFSASIVTTSIINLISKFSDNNRVNAKEIIELAYYSIYLIHNEISRIASTSLRYPPPILRTEIVFEQVREYVSKYILISNAEIKEYLGNASYKIFSHLKDVGMFEQNLSNESLAKLDALAKELAIEYPSFSQHVVDNLEV